MGGPGAPDDVVLGHRTQIWLATGTVPEATTSGNYWYHQHPRTPAAPARDPRFQNRLIDKLASLTGHPLP
jgi:hypothetical protein